MKPCPPDWRPPCTCSLATLEPREDCPVHGWPVLWQCPWCGQMRGRRPCKRWVGYPRDTFDAAGRRLRAIAGLGFTPFAMLWRPMTPAEERWTPAPDWRGFQRQWARPAIIHARGLT
jgi:hypothetical protein